MNFEERKEIIEGFKYVNQVIPFDDSDDSACDVIEKVNSMYDTDHKIYFANGGDRHNENVPEYEKFKDNPNVIFRWAVGGLNKRNSSSWILNEWDKK